jgi:hypothetical protein
MPRNRLAKWLRVFLRRICSISQIIDTAKPGSSFAASNGFLLLAVLDEEIRGTVTHPEYDQQNVIAA